MTNKLLEVFTKEEVKGFEAAISAMVDRMKADRAILEKRVGGDYSGVKVTAKAIEVEQIFSRGKVDIDVNALTICDNLLITKNGIKMNSVKEIAKNDDRYRVLVLDSNNNIKFIEAPSNIFDFLT